MTQTARRQHADAPQFSHDRLKAFIETRLRRREDPAWIAKAVRGYFGVALDADQVVPYWRGEITLPTQTEHRPDKESVQFPADEPKEPLFTRIAEVETPARTLFSIATAPAPTPGDAGADDASATQTGRRQDAESRRGGADAGDAPATQTGRRQDAKSRQGAADADDAPATQTGPGQDTDTLQIPPALQIPADPVDEPRVTREAQEAGFQALAALAQARLGIAPDPAENADGARAEDAATQTGRRQDQKTRSVLTDAQKAHIVRGLARYETPTRVAASVQAEFGITIDRRQVYAYDPAGSRPPAQRWIDLHAATRAKFLDAAAEIGIAQKVVRLRMLDRFANRAEETNYTERAARFLAQAAKECGGFYERYARPKREAAPAYN
ncbi:DUF2280 domain-containing protein [Dongia sedimenti]|uniref:DUF2280 domain-containing protein n=1 Tax=Dongia sedimenti TaxID=3064282 RepID=A0ABU0YJL6_9PROT|nr:DUF2280 domain-containing protein [Rhodospirillaceae bacterium R-7]